MGMLGQMGDMYKLQKEAKRIKKELAKMHIFSEDQGVKVTVTGEQTVFSVEFAENAPMDNKAKLSKIIAETTNKALKKSQTIAAEKMKPLMGGLMG